ncbi:TPA: inovirus-type Gp2 protein [Enterobacter roggenkampii]|nr:inovirus-type Gp2 protein [Escherichia coli]
MVRQKCSGIRRSYLAKLDTKAYGDGDRSFGCSRG